MKIWPAKGAGSRNKLRLILAGSHADEFAECFGKVALIREADPIADLTHAQSPPGNELLGMFDTDAREVTGKSTRQMAVENPTQVIGIASQVLCDVSQQNRIGMVTLQEADGALHHHWQQMQGDLVSSVDRAISLGGKRRLLHQRLCHPNQKMKARFQAGNFLCGNLRSLGQSGKERSWIKTSAFTIPAQLLARRSGSLERGCKKVAEVGEEDTRDIEKRAFIIQSGVYCLDFCHGIFI